MTTKKRAEKGAGDGNDMRRQMNTALSGRAERQGVIKSSAPSKPLKCECKKHPLNRCGSCDKESLACPCYECLFNYWKTSISLKDLRAMWEECISEGWREAERNNENATQKDAVAMRAHIFERKLRAWELEVEK